MSFIKTTDNINMNSKVLAAGVMDANSSAQWYESSFLYENVVDSSKVWAEIDRLKLLPAATRADADAHVLANPDLFEDLSTTGIRITPIFGTNNTTWVAYETYNDTSSARVDGWIQPQLIPQSSGAPSNGYGVQVFTGGDITTGTFLDPTDGLTGTGADASVNWIFNYAMGMLMFSPQNVPTTDEIWIYGYRYTGLTGGASEASSSLPYCQVYDARVADPLTALTLQRGSTADDDVLDSGVTKITTEATTVDLMIAWERISDAGLTVNATLPTINGVEIDKELVDPTVRPFDKVLYATIPYTIDPLAADPRDNDFVLAYNGEQMTITVETVQKPTATIEYTLPDLPWDTVEQSEAKLTDVITFSISDQSEDISDIKVLGGDPTTSFFVTEAIVNQLIPFSDAGTPTDVTFVVDNSETGLRTVSIQVKSAITGAWSESYTFDIILDNDPIGIITEASEYPVGQNSLKDNELGTYIAECHPFDSYVVTSLATPDLTYSDANISTTATEVQITDMATATTLAGTYRYEKIEAFELKLRRTNGMESVVNGGLYVSNTHPTIISPPTPYLVQGGENVELDIVFDQPISASYTGIEIGGCVIQFENLDTTTVLKITVRRDEDEIPGIYNAIVKGVQSSSLFGVPQDLTSLNHIKANGFVQKTILLPSGVRTGSISTWSDLTVFDTPFTVSWDGTETVELQVTTDTSKAGTVTAEKLIYLNITPGNIDFEIIFSDTTILETTLRIEQAGE